MAFYENYVKLCARANKTPSGVAVELGIPKSLVSRWKNGGGASDVTAQKIADYFGVSLAELTGKNYVTTSDLLFEDTKKDPAQSAESKLDIEFASLVEDLTEDELREVMEYMRFKKSQRGK